ncbi:hypothetical protein RHO12_07105 [Orbus sturtevantii]|uniref:hypothetical protein n=1 Tax=Orbus sturtevantii TaxID=3074109 RepID=UPI00370DBD98
MFANLLSRILPKKKESAPLTGRELYGRNNVGYPTMQISTEIDRLVNKYYRDITPLIKFYKETFLFKWGPAIINNSLDDQQLKNLSGRNVQMVYLLLFRDMLRHISAYVTPKNAVINWPDLLAQNLLDNCQMLNDSDDNDADTKQQLFAQSEPYSIENEASQPWVEPIAGLIYVPAKDLYYWHRSLTNTISHKVSKKKKK